MKINISSTGKIVGLGKNLVIGRFTDYSWDCRTFSTQGKGENVSPSDYGRSSGVYELGVNPDGSYAFIRNDQTYILNNGLSKKLANIIAALYQ